MPRSVRVRWARRCASTVVTSTAWRRGTSPRARSSRGRRGRWLWWPTRPPRRASDVRRLSEWLMIPTEPDSRSLGRMVADKLFWGVALWCLIALALHVQGWWLVFVTAYYA